MISAARAHDLEVMLGCMTESAVSIAAGAHLADMLDYADLDGALLLDEDVFGRSPVSADGISISPGTPGLGVTPLGSTSASDRS